MEPAPRTSTDSGTPWSIAAWTLLAAWAAALLALVLAGHPVGDYGPESDFYGGYAEGARAIQRGVWDARRFVVVGPIYEALLALVGLWVGDLFTAAKLISVAAAAGAAAFWLALLSRRIGPRAALWAVAFVIANPTFLRYGGAVSTDMLAVSLQAGCLFALLGWRSRHAPWVAGALAGLATLTRYSSLYLLPVVALLRADDAPVESKLRSRLASAAGFLAVVLPWLAFSLAQGVAPAEGLARGYAFYAEGHGAWNVQDDVGGIETRERIPGVGAVVLTQPVAFLASRLREIPAHLLGDARELLGWPGTIAVLLGLWLLLRDPRRRRLLPLAVAGALCFASLLPAFASARYSLPLVLFYAVAAAGFASTARMPRLAARLVPAVGMAAASLMGIAAVQAQRAVLRESPREVVDAGRALDRAAAPGAPVIGRKGHIGYYSGHPVVPFPRVRTLRELADYARRRHAEYLYFSWFETQMRPELAYLLDTTAAIPGLAVVHASDSKPAILYRIGPDFGRPPEFLASDFQRSVHVARAIVAVQGDRAPSKDRVTLAIDALLRRRWLESLEHARLVTTSNPSHALAWAVQGEALRRLERLEEARVAFVTAIDLDPADPAAKIGLGRIELASGNRPGAVRLWRAAARAADDVRTLEEISQLLGGVADTSGTSAVRRGRRTPERGDDALKPGGNGFPPFCETNPAGRRARRSASL